MKWTQRILYSAAVLFFSMTSVQASLTTATGDVYFGQSKNILFEQFPSNAFSLQLLQTKNQFTPYDLVLGGLAQIDAQRWWGEELVTTPLGIYQKGSGIYLTQITADAAANFNHWSTIFLSVADSHIGRPDVNSNYVYLPNDFIVFGNLDEAPVYLTAGISSIPFGVFAGSGTWDIPLTSTYFSPLQAPQFSLGYFKNNLTLVATGYSDSVSHHNTFAYNANYQKNMGDFGYTIGGGYLTYLTTDSTGSPTNNRARNSIPGQLMGGVRDFNTTLLYKEISVSGEYLAGEKKLLLNHKKPKSYSLSVNYTPTIEGEETPFGVAYSRSIHFRHVPAPLSGLDTLKSISVGLRNVWACSVSRPIFTKNIFLGFDLERAASYENHHSYTGTLDLTAYL